MNPLTGIYGGASALRNLLFDRGLFPTHRLGRPVVSIGNLSAGGAGKTPFVIAMGELLTARGIAFDVLSRGYGRKSRGLFIVDPDGSSSDFGDEPLLIARRLGVPVIIGESRHEAGRLAERKFDTQLHLLDDGFQHRSLARNLDIVLLTERDLRDKLLPSGRLREPLSSLTRADAIVLPAGLNEQKVPRSLNLQAEMVWRVRREITADVAGGAQIVFCGIARPRQFFEQVRVAGIVAVEEVEFRDHHAYKLRDIDRLTEIRTKRGAAGFVTTEKDAINLGFLLPRLQPLAIAKLTVTIENAANVVDTILERIKNRKPAS